MARVALHLIPAEAMAGGGARRLGRLRLRGGAGWGAGGGRGAEVRALQRRVVAAKLIQ